MDFASDNNISSKTSSVPLCCQPVNAYDVTQLSRLPDVRQEQHEQAGGPSRGLHNAVEPALQQVFVRDGL
jgi:hypothetical protein